MSSKHQYGTTIRPANRRRRNCQVVCQNTFTTSQGGQKCGFCITEEQLEEVADLSDVLEGTDDYLKPVFRRECERHLPSPDSIEPAEAADAYRFLKSMVDPNMLYWESESSVTSHSTAMHWLEYFTFLRDHHYLEGGGWCKKGEGNWFLCRKKQGTYILVYLCMCILNSQ